jgi:hypothetical protein
VQPLKKKKKKKKGYIIIWKEPLSLTHHQFFSKKKHLGLGLRLTLNPTRPPAKKIEEKTKKSLSPPKPRRKEKRGAF